MNHMKTSNTPINKTLITFIVITSFLCQNFALAETRHSCLASASFTQKPKIKREIYTALQRTRIIYAESEDARRLLEANNSNALLLSSGKYLVAKETAENDLSLLRAILHEDIEALMQIIARKDRYRYLGIKELILSQKKVLETYYKLFPQYRKPELSEDLLLNDIIAKAIELIFLIEEEMVSEDEMSRQEKEFVKVIGPVIMQNRHNYFIGEFWDSSIRGEKIRIALSKGMRFYQVASITINIDGNEIEIEDPTICTAHNLGNKTGRIIETLLLLGDRRARTKALQEARTHEDGAVVRWLVEQINKLDELKDRDIVGWITKGGLISLLGEIGCEKSKMALVEMLSTGDEEVRAESARQLGRFRGESVVGSLNNTILNDPSVRVQMRAIEAQGVIGHSLGVQVLLRKLRSTGLDPDSISRCRNPRPEHYSDFNKSLCVTIYKALAQILNVHAGRALARAIKEEGYYKFRELKFATRATEILKEIGRDPACSIMHLAQNSNDDRDRILALSTLAHIKTRRSVPILAEGFAEYPGKEEIANALIEIGDETAIIPLVGSLLSDHDVTRFYAAYVIAKLLDIQIPEYRTDDVSMPGVPYHAGRIIIALEDGMPFTKYTPGYDEFNYWVRELVAEFTNRNTRLFGKLVELSSSYDQINRPDSVGEMVENLCHESWQARFTNVLNLMTNLFSSHVLEALLQRLETEENPFVSEVILYVLERGAINRERSISLRERQFERKESRRLILRVDLQEPQILRPSETIRFKILWPIFSSSTMGFPQVSLCVRGLSEEGASSDKVLELGQLSAEDGVLQIKSIEVEVPLKLSVPKFFSRLTELKVEEIKIVQKNNGGVQSESVEGTPWSHEQTRETPVSYDNIGKWVEFRTEGERLSIWGVRGQEHRNLTEDTTIIPEDYSRKEEKMAAIRDLVQTLNVSKIEGFMNWLDRNVETIDIKTFDGTPQSRSAKAFANMYVDRETGNKVILMDNLLLNDEVDEIVGNMVIVHELIHKYLMDMTDRMEDEEIITFLTRLIMDSEMDEELKDRVLRKAGAFESELRKYIAYLRHYYARYYLQNPRDDSGYRNSDNEKLADGIRSIAEGGGRKLRLNPAILAGGFKAEYQGREVHIRGIYPDPRIVGNYISALECRKPNGRRVVPQVYRVYVPFTKLDIYGTMSSGEIVLVSKPESRLPSSTVSLLLRAEQEGLFEVVELRQVEDYRQAANVLNIVENDFLSVMTQTSQMLFVSNWVGPNVEDFIRQHIDNEERLRKVGTQLGETLAALHKSGLIAGDTHLEQFVVRGDGEEVLRIDLVNIYSLNEVSRDNTLIEYNEIYNQLSYYSRIATAAFEAAYRKVISSATEVTQLVQHSLLDRNKEEPPKGSPANVFRILCRQAEPLRAITIASLPKIDRAESTIEKDLRKLVKLGLVKKIGKGKNASYEIVSLTDSEKRLIQRILNEEYKVVTRAKFDRVYTRVIVARLLSTIRAKARNCKDLDEEFVLAVDTDIGNLEEYAKELSEELTKLQEALREEGLDNVRIFVGKGTDLNNELNDYIENNRDEKEFIISAVVKNDNLIQRGLYENVRDKIQITAVDDTNLPNDNIDRLNYIPIIPILELSIKKAVGSSIDNIKDNYSWLPNVKDIGEKNGILIIYLLPKPEPILFDQLRKKYMYEAQVLSSA